MVVCVATFSGASSAVAGVMVLIERAVDQALPAERTRVSDAGVDRAFDERGWRVARHGVDVAGEDGESSVPGALPAGIGRWEARRGRGWRLCGRRKSERGNEG